MSPVKTCPPALYNTFVITCGLLMGSLVQGGQLPDTGQTQCYNTATTTDCSTDTAYPRQDGVQSASISYTKLDAAGGEVAASAADWSCVRDDATGLVWEGKSASGLQAADHRYAWYVGGDVSRNGGIAGNDGNLDTCSGSLGSWTCNAENYANAVNGMGYCGANDWRLPTQAELLTLVHAGNHNPTIDTSFFPNTAPVPYWSATTYAMSPLKAWGVHFGYGAAHAELKSAPNAVRLVRGVWAR